MQRDERAREACGALCAQLISSDLRKEFMDDNFRTTRACAVRWYLIFYLQQKTLLTRMAHRHIDGSGIECSGDT